MIEQSKINKLQELISEFLSIDVGNKAKLSQSEDQIDRLVLNLFQEIEKDASSLADQDMDPLEKLMKAKEAAMVLAQIKNYVRAAKIIKAREGNISTKSKKVFNS